MFLFSYLLRSYSRKFVHNTSIYTTEFLITNAEVHQKY